MEVSINVAVNLPFCRLIKRNCFQVVEFGRFHINNGGVDLRLIHFSLVLHSHRNQSNDLQCKSSDWFLYEMQHWAEMG